MYDKIIDWMLVAERVKKSYFYSISQISKIDRVQIDTSSNDFPSILIHINDRFSHPSQMINIVCKLEVRALHHSL